MSEYISKEKVIESMQPKLRLKLTSEYGMGYLHAIKHVLELIDVTPAADVQPVKHGEWVSEWERNCYKCSECECMYTMNYKYKYCPNCGTRMDGDAE